MEYDRLQELAQGHILELSQPLEHLHQILLQANAQLYARDRHSGLRCFVAHSDPPLLELCCCIGNNVTINRGVANRILIRQHPRDDFLEAMPASSVSSLVFLSII